MTGTSSGDALGSRVGPFLGEGPAAVLLVDLDGRMVVHANPVAAQLAPGVRLPVDLETWSDAAELRDPEGEELSETHHPLSRVLRAEPVMGQAVTAGRRSELGHRREPLWVVGLPMREARELENHALVVLLPMPGSPVVPTAAATDTAASQATEQEMARAVDRALDLAAPGSSGSSLRERALMATGLSFTVADAQADGFPLVWVNPAFTRTTGYTFEESVGSNCRFLQGPDTDPEAPRAIRAALARGEAITTVLLNYTKDGLAFWNQVTISPIFSGEGDLTHYVGIQGDVSGRIEADRQRDEALAAERRARAEAETAQGRLRFLAEATSRLTGTLDIEECRDRLIELVVPGLADWAVVLHRDDHGALVPVRHAHVTPALDGVLSEHAGGLSQQLVGSPVHEVLADGSTGRLVVDVLEPSRRHGRDSDLTDLLERLGSRSAISVPLPGRLAVEDVLVMLRGPGRTSFTPDDLEVALDLGQRVGLILDNARLFAVQQRIAETLQRSLLTEPPSIPGLQVAARYRAVESGAEVGGDFYEVIALPSGRVGIVVGDVVGHDVFAAAAMGHLKGVLRACAYDAGSSPARVLERVDELLVGLGIATMATAVYGELSPEPHADGWRLTWSCAGHPPLLLRHPDGRVEALGAQIDVNDPLLGVQPGRRRERHTTLAPGSTLVAYTDGLIERRGEVLDLGLDRLAAAVRTGPADADGLCEHLLDTLEAGGDDDIVVLVLQID